MKKIIVAASFFGVAFVVADQSVVTATAEPSVVIEEPTAVPAAPTAFVEETAAANDECQIGGLQLFGGVVGSFMNWRVDTVEKDNKNASGSGTSNNASKASDVKWDNANTFGGVVGIGYGKPLQENFYLGAEAMVEFGGSKKKDEDKENETSANNPDWKLEKKKNTSFFIPTFGIRLGYLPCNDTMVYTKISAAWSDLKVTHKDDANNEIENRKVGPALAIGIEKAFNNKFSARLEGEYKFRSSDKHKNFETNRQQLDQSRWAVRALISFNIR